jgi:hypothetical protein
VIRYFIARDAKFDPSHFIPQAFATRMQELSALIDATNPDLSNFKQRGGKLIMRSNLADYWVSPFESMNYYEAVTKSMGRDAVDQFLRITSAPAALTLDQHSAASMARPFLTRWIC